MFAGEGISGLAMIELAGCRLPFDDVEILPVVIRMASDAVFASVGVFHHMGVKTASGSEAVLDFAVAAQTPEARRAGAKDVTCRALCRSAEVVVSARQRAGRNLGGDGNAETQKE
jgi:hypothetical protein